MAINLKNDNQIKNKMSTTILDSMTSLNTKNIATPKRVAISARVK